MICLLADESYDNHTYVLGGWLVTPTHYDVFENEWRKLLKTLTMPDGSACRAFHASAIMSQRTNLAAGGKKKRSRRLMRPSGEARTLRR
jgi:hypothetical protein